MITNTIRSLIVVWMMKMHLCDVHTSMLIPAYTPRVRLME